ncbi:MAG: integration host factor subunit beta [Ignavibacteriales bacterium]|nr:integration host factor subunit beta [Ignavibacteriales bacterium]
MKTFTKRDIVKRVARTHGSDLTTTAKWVDDIFSAIRDIMMTADPVLRIEVRDFGVFEVKQTKSKPKARNPKSGEIVQVPPRRKTHFKPSKLLKKFLSQPLDTAVTG